MSGFSYRGHAVLVAAGLALSLSFVGAATAQQTRAGIFMNIVGIKGTTGPCGSPATYLTWIRVATLQIGSQTIAANNPWYITPSPGVREITLTRTIDSVTPSLSTAFAKKWPMGTVTIDLCQVDARGTVKQVSRYNLPYAMLSSFTTAPPTETLVLSFGSLTTGFPIRPTATPTLPIRRFSAPAATGKGLRLAPTPPKP